jgi:hypothetical protein
VSDNACVVTPSSPATAWLWFASTLERVPDGLSEESVKRLADLRLHALEMAGEAATLKGIKA